jgi:hypothetical protein
MDYINILEPLFQQPGGSSDTAQTPLSATYYDFGWQKHLPAILF